MSCCHNLSQPIAVITGEDCRGSYKLTSKETGQDGRDAVTSGLASTQWPHRISQSTLARSASFAAFQSHTTPTASTKTSSFQTVSSFIRAKQHSASHRVKTARMYLTSGPNADNLLTLARTSKNMSAAAKKDPLYGKGPVFRTLREIMALPLDQRLDAFVDRLDLLDKDELEKVVLNGKGDEYPACSNAVRLKILDVGKQWLHDAEKQGAPTGKLAALRVFDAAPKKAG